MISRQNGMRKDDGMRMLRSVSSIIVSASFLVTVLGSHHSDPNDEQIIFLLDLMVVEGKEAEAEVLIDKLVENVKKTEPGTIVYEYYASSKDRYFLYEVYRNQTAAEFHVDSFMKGNLMPAFVETFEVITFEVLGSTSDELKKKMIDFTSDHRAKTDGFKR
ncbi:putative quinol monooxygenase [Candidatus Pelagisphaera phototrophica]|uniref:putative quinol monooxygenase n=1 Tax=Candidatus Pelagisphaera phototrophica TaxID=2684113 RepID=UPI001A066435|nr:antibiotic biosynthesis monooxygenase [Candidatus Pelagisphaera phototrophica]QXD31104.1 antibiotic biosynthesis monooxygenase [Candidatus Pelagisphaera phototrophica]